MKGAPQPDPHHFAVGLDALHVLLVALGLLLLLNARNDAPGSTTRANNILVSN